MLPHPFEGSAQRAVLALLTLIGAGACEVGAMKRGGGAPEVDHPEALRVVELNEEIEGVRDALRAAGEEDRALRDEGARLLEERAEALAVVIEEAPAQVAPIALTEERLEDLAASFPGSEPLLEERGVWEGSIRYEVSHGHDVHRSEIRLTGDGGARLLSFVSNGRAGELESEDFISARGIRLGDQIAVEEAEVFGSMLAGGSCETTGPQGTAVLLVKFPGEPKPDLTPEHFREAFFGTSGRSLKTYWQEVSYGKTWAYGAVKGWYTLDRVYACNEPYALRAAAIRAADGDIEFTHVDRLFIVFPPEEPGCSYAGKGTIGCNNLESPGDGAFAASTSWIRADQVKKPHRATQLALHEGAHNLGLHHAATRDFGDRPLGAPGVSGSIYGYGDKSSAVAGHSWGHFGARHKERLGWLTGGVEEVQSSGAFTISPIETSGPDTKALRVRRSGTDAWLWVEYRQPIGFDAEIAPGYFGGALLYYEDELTGNRTHLLDFTPKTDSFEDAPLAPGRSWKDPFSNLEIHVGTGTEDALQVQVNYQLPDGVR